MLKISSFSQVCLYRGQEIGPSNRRELWISHVSSPNVAHDPPSRPDIHQSCCRCFLFGVVENGVWSLHPCSGQGHQDDLFISSDPDKSRHIDDLLVPRSLTMMSLKFFNKIIESYRLNSNRTIRTHIVISEERIRDE